MDIEVGYQAFVSDGGEEFGAVRAVTPDFVLVWVENAGEFRLPRDAVQDVHSQKVIFDCRSSIAGCVRRSGTRTRQRSPDSRDDAERSPHLAGPPRQRVPHRITPHRGAKRVFRVVLVDPRYVYGVSL